MSHLLHVGGLMGGWVGDLHRPTDYLSDLRKHRRSLTDAMRNCCFSASGNARPSLEAQGADASHPRFPPAQGAGASHRPAPWGPLLDHLRLCDGQALQNKGLH